MGKMDILIGMGILVILLALAGTGSAFKSGSSGYDCYRCHPSQWTFSNIAFYNQTHRYNDTVQNPPSCENCHAGAWSSLDRFNFSLRTGTATYLTSTTCENCHKAKYDDWQGTMHRVMLTSNSTAQAMGLPTPSGFSWANMSYVIVGKLELRYLNESGYLVKRYISENQTFADYGPRQYTCGSCHTTGYNPIGNQSGLPGIVGTWSEPGIACERCHGPGGNGHQVEANVSEQVCLQCHNGSTRQGTFLSSAHSPPLEAPTRCLMCHSPFDYARNNTVTSTTAINVVCANCHNSHNTSDDKYRALFSPGGFDQAVYANASDAKNSFFNSTASRLLLTGGPTGMLTAGKDVYDILTTPALIPADIVDESYGGPIEVTGPISEVLCSNCHYEHGLGHVAGVNLTHARLNYPGLGLAPATCTDCHMSGDLKKHSFNVKDETDFPSNTCSRGTECHVTSDQNLNHSRFSVVPVVNEWNASAHNDKEVGINKSRNYNVYYWNNTAGVPNSQRVSCNKCHSPMDWNPLQDSNTANVPLTADFKGITCAVCHNLHDMGDWLKKTNDTFGKPKAYAWYNKDAIPIINDTTGAITRYKANYSMMANTTELCGNCHSNIRIGNTGPGYGTPSSRNPTGIISPHGFPAKDIFVGSWKQTNDFECIDCHMAKKITDPTNLTEMVLPDSQKVTGHSFKVNVPILQNETKCLGCHVVGDISTRIDVIKADTQTKWNATNITVMDALAQINAFTGPKNLSRDLIAEAYWNLRMVSSDESWGVHNPNGTNKLLDDATALANESLAKLGQTGISRTITVSPATATLAINGTQIFNATARDQNGTPMSGITIVWASNNTTVGNVSPITATTDVSGGATTTFTAGARGNAMITANNDTVAGSANVTVTTAPVVAKIVISQITVVVGTTVTFSAQAFDQFNNPVNVTLTWASSNTTVGTIDPTTGTFISKANGTTTINATNGSVVGSVNIVVISSPAGLLKTITVSPATTNLAVNGTQVFTATALDQNSIPMAGINITWLSNNTTVGNVSPANSDTGAFGNATTTFTANAEGIAMVTAMNGAVAGSANVTVSPAPAPTQAFNISGFKINSANNFGVPGWTINLTNATMNVSANTEANGMYQFTGLANGTYKVTEMMQTDWTNVTPTSIDVQIEGVDVMNQNFTNTPSKPPVSAQTFNISGFKINSANNFGVPGWTINLTNATMNVSANTEANGMYQFTGLANGTYKVTEIMQTDWTNVTPTSIDVVIAGADVMYKNFTNVIIPAPDLTIDLDLGWNLISIPNFADPSSVDMALKNVKNNGVVGYDPATKTFSTPTDLYPLYGYWINVTEPNQSLGFIADKSITSVPPSRNLYEGWNLIGVVAEENETNKLDAGLLFQSLQNGGQPLYSFLVSYKNPRHTYAVGVDLTDRTPLNQGQGYWLFIKTMTETDKNSVIWSGKPWLPN